MDPKVKEYLLKKECEQQKERSEFLISQGLYTREFAPSDAEVESSRTLSMQYPNSDYFNGEYKHYRDIPVCVTDEEYAAIREAYESCKKTTNVESSVVSKASSEETNSCWVATLFKVSAWIILICGLIAGYFYGYYEESYYSSYYDLSYTTEEYDIMRSLIVWVSAFVAWMGYFAIAKIIELLNDIKNRLH